MYSKYIKRNLNIDRNPNNRKSRDENTKSPRRRPRVIAFEKRPFSSESNREKPSAMNEKIETDAWKWIGGKKRQSSSKQATRTQEEEILGVAI